FRLGAYRFDRYRAGKPAPTLAATSGADAAEVDRLVDAATLARDLINTPANDLGPDAFEKEIRAFAAARKMKIKVTAGDALLRANFPMNQGVGRARSQGPGLVELTWGRARDP